MAIHRNGAATKYKFLHNGKKLKRGYHNSETIVWSASSPVTYHVDTGVSYIEEVDDGATCLAPTNFTPTKSGWTFVGWREDDTANSSVLTSKVMGTDPITLYAVFKKDIVVTWFGGNGNNGELDKTRYYNNGNYLNPSVTLSQSSVDGWNSRGWGTSDAADADVIYTNGSHEVTSDITVYALYEQTVTRTFHSMNGTTDKSEPVIGTAYYNASGNTAKAAIVVPSGGTYTGWTWRGWSGVNVTTADANVVSESGKTIYTLDDGDVYGLYQADVILTTVVNSVSTEHKKVKYYNASGSRKNPQFTVADPALENYIFLGWSLQSSSEEIAHTSIANMTLSSNLTVYAVMRLHLMTVYDATYDWPDSYYTSNPPKTVHVNDTTYVSTAGEVGKTIGGDTNDNNTYTTPDEILLILSAASANFKYADITFEYYNYVEYGESESYIDGESIGAHDGTNVVHTKTVTWEIAEKIKCSGRVRLVDKSSSTTYWCHGFIGVKKVVLREWTGITSYLVNFADYPITKTSSSLDHGDGGSNISTDASKYSMSIKKNKDSGGTGNIKATVSLPTQGCNKVSVTYTCSSASGATINGTSLLSGWTSYKEDTIIFSCSGDTFNLNLEVYDATGDNTALLQITKIRFYCE